MSDHRTITKRRTQFYDWLKGIPGDQRRSTLLTVLRAPHAASAPDELRADPELLTTFAALAMVQFRLYHTKAQGRRYLRRGLQTLEKRCGDAPRNRALLRDAANVRGNFHARHFETMPAMQAYATALEGERSPERRGLITVNLVKLLVGQSRHLEALRLLERFDVERVGNPVVSDALTLAKTRLLLTLGSVEDAEQRIVNTRGRTLSHATNELERRYVGFVLRLKPSAPARNAARLDEFLGWVSGRCDAKVSAFYELEGLLLRAAWDGAAAGRGKIAFKPARAGNLARVSGATDLLAIYKAMSAALSPRRPSPRAALLLRESLRAFGARDGALTFQIVAVGIAQTFLARGAVEEADEMFFLFRAHLEQLRAGMPPRLLARLAASPSALVDTAAMLSSTKSLR